MARRISILFALLLALNLVPGLAGADVNVDKSDNVTQLAHLMQEGGATEVDYDGERYAYVGQWNGTTDTFDRRNVSASHPGGLWIIDLVGDEETEPLSVVGKLPCPGTDNYVRYMNPEVFNTEEGDREFVAMAHHGNFCSRITLRNDPNTVPSYGAYNGVSIVDVTDKANPTIASVIGHYSAHTVMPHPTRPYLYILPGGLANGTETNKPVVSPTGIVDVSDPYNPRYVQAFQHNATGCHDLGFTPDGNHAYCAGLAEVQVWDVSGDNIESPQVVNTITNPAIQFPHNAVVSDDGKYMLINDEAFGFHTCRDDAADLYGSLWIYDISIPNLPVLAGRIAPPAIESEMNVADWVASWCAAHNYNFVPGTHIVVASWFAGGMTAHDISNPLEPVKLAHYMPDGGVAWSAHYYGGYVLTGDMARGVEILDVPDLREAEEAAKGDDEEPTGENGTTALSSSSLAPRVDVSELLIPDVLPPRPPRPAASMDKEGGFCVIPGGFKVA